MKRFSCFLPIFSLSLGNRTCLQLIDIWGAQNEMLQKQLRWDWQAWEWSSGARSASAWWQSCNKWSGTGEMIANVSLKFSLVKTRIVLLPYHCWTKLCASYLSSHWKTCFASISLFLSLTVLECFTDPKLYWCSFNQEGLFWSESGC